MASDRAPKRRGADSAPPVLRPRAFWESPESKKVREVGNSAYLAKYEAELNAEVAHVKSELRAAEAQHTLSKMAELADHAQNVVDSELKAQMAMKLLDAWTDGESARMRDTGQ